MFITDISIKKSLTVFIGILIIIIIGAMSYVTLPREAAPDITIPVVIVQTFYFGVSPADIETLITNPIEKKLKGLENVKTIMSWSSDSASTIRIEFVSGSDIDKALDEVKEKVDLAKTELPEEAEDPQVIEINISDFPIMVLNISGPYGRVRLKNIAEGLKDKVEAVPGVLSAEISGGLEREIQIIADMGRLQKYGLSLNDISAAIKAENITIPGGTIELGNTKYLIRVPGEFKDASKFNNIIVDTPQGAPIYLRDVAQVRDSFKDIQTFSRLNNIESVSLSIQKRSGENLIAIAQQIKDIIETEKQQLPQALEITYVSDQSERISDMVNELENSIILGLILVVLVLNLFMGVRNSLFVAVAIPFSMLISFTVLQLMGISLNMVVLFSLILALGMLVDNAIVIVENIYRHMEEGYSRQEAARIATDEVAWPVIASTATTVAAFLPILFMPGIAGQFMGFIPTVVIITITSSLFVAMVINPVICSTFMHISKRFKDKKNNNSEALVNFYKYFLEIALRHRKFTIMATFGALILSILIFIKFSPGFEFFPDVTPSMININISTPDGSTIEYTNDILKQIEQDIIDHPNVYRVISTIRSSGGFSSFGGSSGEAGIMVEFNEPEDQVESPIQTISWLREKISGISGAEIELQKERMGPPTGAAIGVKISGMDYNILSDLSQKVQNLMLSIGGIVDIKDDYSTGRSEIVVDIERDAAALLGVNTAMIASTIRTAVQGSKVSVFREGNEEYDITLQLDKSQRRSIEDLNLLVINGREGRQFPLQRVANINIENGVGIISHRDLDRVITVEATPAEGKLANERLKALAKEIDKIDLPSGYTISYVGESEEMGTMAAYLKKAFLIALLLIAAILITQFNSIILPAIIMASVFFSLIGIFLGLVIFRQPFGVVMTGIGIISLAGVVVNNAIVLIDYIGQLRAQDMNTHDAVVQAGLVRLRPVLLTAVTTILGLVPMTFGINFDFKMFFSNLLSINIFSSFFNAIEIGGRTSEFWSSMGSAVTIGLATGTVLTLIVVPVMYIMLDNVRKKFPVP